VTIGAVQVFALAATSPGTANGWPATASGVASSQAAGLAYRQLKRLVPTGLPGGDRGDLLTRLISDTDEAQDLVVRAAVPVVAAVVACRDGLVLLSGQGMSATRPVPNAGIEGGEAKGVSWSRSPWRWTASFMRTAWSPGCSSIVQPGTASFRGQPGSDFQDIH
jgi:hypothetical protein